MITFKRKINLVCILNLKMYFYIYRHTHKEKRSTKILLLDFTKKMDEFLLFLLLNLFTLNFHYLCDTWLVALIIFISLWCCEILQVVGIGWFWFGEYRETLQVEVRDHALTKDTVITIGVCEEDFLRVSFSFFCFWYKGFIFLLLKLKSVKSCIWHLCLFSHFRLL
jgi:hypothetical protein